MSENVLAVSGLAAFADYETVEKKLKKYLTKVGDIKAIVTEDRTDGTVAMVRDFCKAHRISWRGIPLNRERDGKAAVFVMNSELITLCSHVLVFSDGEYVVTEDVVAKAIQAGKYLFVVKCLPSEVRYQLSKGV